MWQRLCYHARHYYMARYKAKQQAMREVWEIVDKFRAAPVAEHLKRLSDAYALEGEWVTEDPKSLLQKCQLNGENFYVKRYRKSGKYLRKYFGRSRVRAEWENLLAFKAWGIPTPELVAYGEQHEGLVFQRGVLVTKELAGARDLETFYNENANLFCDPVWFGKLVEKLADYVRRLHQHAFAHNDLDWRNILLVNHNNDPELYFFDSPAGRFWRLKPMLEYRVVKDLAHLDKIARQVLTRRQRLLFYRLYSQSAKLTSKDKKRIRKILAYYDR